MEIFISNKNTEELFINKYKPNTIDEFCADNKLKSVLKTLLLIDDLNILLIGDTCSGKTTILNAIIREYYNIDNFILENNSNILYINNLKEQGIGFYRNEMKTFSQSHSNIFGKKKMIIIDDIDTINEQSQHVFRNYIDKYKHNVHFLSVCTNIQKVIESIQSRVHIIRIEPPTEEQIRQLMYRIMKEEQLRLSIECQEFILKYSKRSIRTMINFIEKIFILVNPRNLRSDKDITGGKLKETLIDTPDAIDECISLQTCIDVCSDIKIHIFEKYIENLKNNELTKSIEIIYSIHDYGFSVIDILELFFVFVKETSSLKEEEKYEIIKLLCKYITLFYSVHEDIIELALLTVSIGKLLSTVAAASVHPDPVVIVSSITP
jgi:DNA polymerase III delta prime subunit